MRNRGWILAGFVALAVIAVAGWARKPAPAAAFAMQPAVPCVQPAQFASSPADSADRNAVRVVRRAAPPASAGNVAPRPQVRKGRSTAKSAAIVAGSAGVGAAIGGLAGGGKGAAIGAISGGAAGFVYDRLTHNGR